jgi:hypothetical protein
MFVADRLVDCTTPAVLPVAYFIMLGMRSWPPRSASWTCCPPAAAALRRRVAVGELRPDRRRTRLGRVRVQHLAGRGVPHPVLRALGAVYLIVGLPVFAVVLRLYEWAVPDLEA